MGNKRSPGLHVHLSAKDIDGILDSTFGSTPVASQTPVGFEPLGKDTDCPGCDPKEIPKSFDDLGELISSTYDLSVRRAGELNIPVVGTVSGGYNRRVVVYEWTRYKTLRGTDDIECRFGYVIRFCLTVSKWDAQTKVSLPFLSAQAELGNIQASWLMQIRGLAGRKIDEAVLPPQELKVETFVIARQSLNAVIKAINEPSTKFVSGILLARINPFSQESKYWTAAVQAFAVDCVRRRRKRVEAQVRLGSSDLSDRDLITEVYAFFGINDPGKKPGIRASDKAKSLLRGLQVDK